MLLLLKPSHFISFLLVPSSIHPFIISFLICFVSRVGKLSSDILMSELSKLSFRQFLFYLALSASSIYMFRLLFCLFLFCLTLYTKISFMSIGQRPCHNFSLLFFSVFLLFKNLNKNTFFSTLPLLLHYRSFILFCRLIIC